jgi:hypothetical protein
MNVTVAGIDYGKPIRGQLDVADWESILDSMREAGSTVVKCILLI